MRSNFFLTVISLALITVCVSCSSDDDDVSSNVDNLTGTWICYEQTWHEDGKTWSKSYSGNDYYIVFNNNNSGSMNSGSDELMEIGRSHSFTYTFTGNNIISDIYGETIWMVVSLSDKQLTLKWEDEGYWIECKFKKFGADSDDGELTSESLVGRWACLAFTDEDGQERTFSINDLKLAAGEYAWYIEFNSDGTGYKNVGSYMVLGSTSTPFYWTFSKNVIQISNNGIDETDWRVESFKKGVLVLSSHNKIFKATLKKGGIRKY